MTFAEYLEISNNSQQRFNYPDVVDREYHEDGSLKSGKYNGTKVTVSHKKENDPVRTHTAFLNGKAVHIHINGKQAINPAFSWYHEIAHIEKPHGSISNSAYAEYIADKHAITKTNMGRKDYIKWLLTSDRSKDSPAHVKARLGIVNNLKEWIR